MKPDNCCHSCQANWNSGEWTPDCIECGGGALERDCTLCMGRCGAKWQKAIMDSHDFARAHWTGSCQLPPKEQEQFTANAKFTSSSTRSPSKANWKEKVFIRQGDITDEDTDVIVNAANEELARGGGECGSIHTVAGPELKNECDDIGGCATGDVAMTDGYDLPCRKVIHAVGPIYCAGANEEEADLLASCYLESLRLVASIGFNSISFPSISTGTYGYPIEEACRIAIAAVKEGLEENPEIGDVNLVCFEVGDFEEYQKAMAEQD